MKLPIGDKAKQLARAGLHFAAVPGAMLWVASLGWARQEDPVNAVWGFAAALIGIGAGFYRFWRRDERKQILAIRLILGLSFAVLLILATNLVLALLLAAIYGVLMVFLQRSAESKDLRPFAAGILQFTALWAVFLAAAVWHWPTVLIILLTWLVSYTVGYWYLDIQEDRAGALLASTWALIASQCAWIFSIWLVNYLVAGGWVIIPQAALVITALGYVYSGIYLAHKKAQLGRWRLAEYLLVGLLLILIVAVGTRWTATI